MATKKEMFKDLFYSNLTAVEIQRKLRISTTQYREFLNEAKEEFGLPKDYRRTPHRYGRYVKDSYLIKKYTNLGFDIIAYAPTEADAENKVRILDDGVSIYKIEKASDENLLKSLAIDYEHGCKWDDMLVKYQLPYHKFYKLWNKIKEQYGKSDNKSNREQRYIYKYSKNKKYLIRKTLKGKQKGFGYYTEMCVAIKVRDYLEEIEWNIPQWESEKKTIIKKAENEC